MFEASGDVDRPLSPGPWRGMRHGPGTAEMMLRKETCNVITLHVG